MEQYELSADINATAQSCYRLFRNFSAMPSYMENIKEMKELRQNVWRWVLIGEKGDESTWEMLLEHDIPEKMLVLRTLSGPEIEMSLEVDFQDLRPGVSRITLNMVILTVEFGVGKLLLGLFGVSRTRLEGNLQHFKAKIESMEAEKAGRGETRPEKVEESPSVAN